MSFFERVAARVFTHIFEKVWVLVEARVQKAADIAAISKKHDKIALDLKEELKNAKTMAEVDQVLDKIYDYSNPV